MQRKGNPHALLIRMEIAAAIVENNMGFSWKTKLLCGLEIPFLGIYPKKQKH